MRVQDLTRMLRSFRTGSIPSGDFAFRLFYNILIAYNSLKIPEIAVMFN